MAPIDSPEVFGSAAPAVPAFAAEEIEPVPGPSAPLHRGRSRRAARARRRKTAFVLGALLITAAIFVFAARSALNAPRFHLASIRPQGCRYVTTAEVEDRFSADRDKSVLLTPLERRRQEIEQIPWVRSATLRRVFPNEIWVMVRERSPVAFLATAGGLSLVDSEGVILEPPKSGSFHFPVVRGLSEDESAASRREKMQLFAALMKDLARGGLPSNETISEVDLADPRDARMIISDSSGTVLVHLGKENFLARYLIYLSHIEEWKRKFPTIQSVDLRYEGQAVINADPQGELQDRGKGPLPPSDSKSRPPTTRNHE